MGFMIQYTIGYFFSSIPLGCRLVWTCCRSPLWFPILPAKKPIDFPHDKIEEEREDVDDGNEEQGQQTSQANLQTHIMRITQRSIQLLNSE